MEIQYILDGLNIFRIGLKIFSTLNIDCSIELNTYCKLELNMHFSIGLITFMER